MVYVFTNLKHISTRIKQWITLKTAHNQNVCYICNTLFWWKRTSNTPIRKKLYLINIFQCFIYQNMLFQVILCTLWISWVLRGWMKDKKIIRIPYILHWNPWNIHDFTYLNSLEWWMDIENQHLSLTLLKHK